MWAGLDTETGPARTQASETKRVEGQGPRPQPAVPKAATGRRCGSSLHPTLGTLQNSGDRTRRRRRGEARSSLVWRGLPWEGESEIILLLSAAGGEMEARNGPLPRLYPIQPTAAVVEGTQASESR